VSAPASERGSQVAGAVVSLGLVAGFVLLSLNDKPTSDLIGLVSVGILPLLALTLYGKLAGIQAQGAAVATQTNGTTTELLRQNAALQQALAQVAGVPVPQQQVWPAESATAPGVQMTETPRHYADYSG
jgi:hypothetical protein